ncbi:MAG: Rieske 2Fe-2S domain-containing protein [Candidatus Binatia bacterium]
MYKTTKEENEILTRVGPGTPMGELLRRYWWPVGFSAHLKDKPTFIRVLCEDLVLFRDGKGKAGVLGAYCSHRRANLCLGNVEKEGLRCRYHGWLYDINGKVLQTPGELPGSKLKENIHHLSYPTQELGGLVFTYLGPQPAPLLPRFHFLAADGERDCLIQAFNDSNWLQSVENGIDPYHVSFLHGDVWRPMAAEPEKIMFEETDWGAVYKAIRPGRKAGEYSFRMHYIIMPGIASGGDNTVSSGGDLPSSEFPAVTCRWAVPIDDTHTMNLRVRFKPPKQHRVQVAEQLRIEPYKEYKESDNPTLGYDIPAAVFEEDATIVDSLGPIVDRENETLSVIDRGVILLRQVYLKEIEKVKAGKDPKGVIRDLEKNRLIVIGGDYRWMSADERRQVEQATP